MGAVGGLLGFGGGTHGTGYSAPASAPITQPTTAAQANTAYTGAQQGLTAQQNLLSALQAQNGLQNQAATMDYLNQIRAGLGANPAKAMLAQATGQNVANQAALMAAQRGAGANVGLLARQAAMQGANTQQQAAGQAATQQAQQTLNALTGMGNLATTQAQQQIGATAGLSQAEQNEQQNLLNAIAQQNNAKVGMQSNVNQGNAALAGQTMAGQQGLLGGLAGGIAGSLGGLFADGGAVSTPGSTPQSFMAKFLHGFGQNGEDSESPTGFNAVGNMLGKGIASLFHKNGASESDDQDENYLDANVALDDAAKAAGQNWSPNETQLPANADEMLGPAAARGGKVPAMVSPGEQYLPPEAVRKVAVENKNPLAVGERIPGKPKYKGNDYRNDTVPKTLEEGGIVIPNSVMQKQNPHWEAMKFVHQTLAKSKRGIPKKSGK